MQSLLETLKLRRTGEDTFQSVNRAWAPEESLIAGIPKELIEKGTRALFGDLKSKPDGAGSEKSPPAGLQRGGNVYGGHVLGQALWAASLYGKFGTGSSRGLWTVHSVHAHFLRPGKVVFPFNYKVTPLFEGGTFCSRTVTVTQSPKDGETVTIFSAICAFKLPEKQILAHEAKFDPRGNFEKILASKAPEDWPLEDGVDAPWYRNIASGLPGFKEIYQALEMRLVTPENFPKLPFEEQRTFHFYKPVGPLELPAEITAGLNEDEIKGLRINLQACAHMYASDRNSLFHISNLHEASAMLRRIASITHVVIFHGAPEDLEWADRGDGKWFVQEVWSDQSGYGRGIHNTRLWRWSDEGATKLVGSTVQDGLIRYKEESKI